MKKILILSMALLATLLTFSAKYTELPADYAGTMRPYDFSRADTARIWPDSLKPVCVVHVARHGSRYISSARKFEKIEKALYKASMERNITPLGDEFMKLLGRVNSVSEGKWGLLSDVGCEEQIKLAKEMYGLMPELIDKADVKAISTYVPRVAMTMYQYCHELTRLTDHIDITACEGRKYSPLVRCFTADNEYQQYREDGDWREVYDGYVRKHVSYQPARRMIGPNGNYSKDELREMTMEIYSVLQSLTAFGMEAPTDQFMSAGEYENCWRASNLYRYLINTINPLSDLAGKATAPLLQALIDDAESSLQYMRMHTALENAGNDSTVYRPQLNFYFGHAETLLPLLSLMRVPGCHALPLDYDDLYKEWRDYDITPLGANLDLILLQAPSGEIRAVLRLNSRYVDMQVAGGKIVAWETLKQFYQDILNSIERK